MLLSLFGWRETCIELQFSTSELSAGSASVAICRNGKLLWRVCAALTRLSPTTSSYALFILGAQLFISCLSDCLFLSPSFLPFCLCHIPFDSFVCFLPSFYVASFPHFFRQSLSQLAIKQSKHRIDGPMGRWMGSGRILLSDDFVIFVIKFSRFI